MARRDLRHAILDDRPLVSQLLGLSAQGTLRTLSQTCRRWASDAFDLAPGDSRTLAALSTWPSALRGDLSSAERERLAKQELLARRARLVETIRMSCQDPHVTENAGVTPASIPAVCDVPLEEAGAEWFRHPAFRDRSTTDEELLPALRRGAPGDVRKLLLCSSRLTDAGVCQALAPHWPSLVDLCLCNCGLAGGRLTGASLARLLCGRGAALGPRSTTCSTWCGWASGAPTRLRSLILIDIPNIPLAALAGACDLRALTLRGGLSAPSVEAISGCRNLETLRLSLEGQVLQDPFIRVFTECRKLRVVDIHGATDVSDQILACLMLHAPGLEDFRGSHAGDHLSCSHVLSGRMTEAFKAHFSGARRIFIDNLVRDSLL